MNAVMRIGIAGAGLTGRKHIELIEASRDCVLAGIADPSLDAKAFAEARSAVREAARTGAGISPSKITEYIA
jgi:predicted dehydrogenase